MIKTDVGASPLIGTSPTCSLSKSPCCASSIALYAAILGTSCSPLVGPLFSLFSSSVRWLTRNSSIAFQQKTKFILRLSLTRLIQFGRLQLPLRICRLSVLLQALQNFSSEFFLSHAARPRKWRCFYCLLPVLFSGSCLGIPLNRRLGACVFESKPQPTTRGTGAAKARMKDEGGRMNEIAPPGQL